MNKYQKIYDYWNSSNSAKVQDYLEQAQAIKKGDLETWPDEIFLRDFVLPGMFRKTCLEVGSGPGRMVKWFANAGVIFTASDFSESFFPELQIVCKMHGVNSVRLDITKDSLKNEFDYIFCTQVLLHIHPDLISNAVNNLKKMAKDKIIVITWQGEEPFCDSFTKKTQSFNHNYLKIFKENDLQINLEMDIYFNNKNWKKVKNKVFYLSK